jgi:tRNA-specific 2-thiouridylase
MKAMKELRIAVGLSGGVDSSVAAYLLVKAGHDVRGVTMKLWAGESVAHGRKSGCYGPGEADDIDAARRVCAHLAIPFSLLDCSDRYEDLVLRYFRDEYHRGRTPNPCVRCNELVKFGLLPLAARDAGVAFDSFATGHYARVERDPRTGRFLLKKGLDAGKDQSYFLYRLSQEQLAATLFPLGDKTKAEVRRIAEEARLPVHGRKESQDFFDGDVKDILGQDDREGDIVDSRGVRLGTHRGIWRYTIGQRKGLRLSSPEPLYVIGIEPETNKLVVGPKAETLKRSCVVGNCRWIPFNRPDGALDVEVKVRSTGRPARGTVSPLDPGTARVMFDEPQSALTPGQSAVFYRADLVLGGGVIESAA